MEGVSKAFLFLLIYWTLIVLLLEGLLGLVNREEVLTGLRTSSNESEHNDEWVLP